MVASLSAASSSDARGGLRCVERCWPKARQARRCDTASGYRHARHRPDDERRLEVSLRRLFRDQPVERQVRDRTAQSGVLLREFLEPLHLIDLQAVVLRAPPVARSQSPRSPSRPLQSICPRTSSHRTCRSLVTIASGEYFFRDIDALHRVVHSNSRPGPLQRGQVNGRTLC